MTRLIRLALVAAATLVATPAGAAVTAKKISVDDNPRAAWFERFQQSRQGPEQTDTFKQTVKVPADGSLTLENLSGDVRVSPGRGNEIQIEAIKRVRARDTDDARRLLEQLRVEVSTVGNRVEVRTIYPRGSYRNVSTSVDYTITVPQTLNVSLKTISGDVTVTGVRGEVRAESTSGDVTVTATPNLASAKTISGDVIARDINTTTAMLTLGTISGTVIASGIKVRALEAGTVSGNLQLSNLQTERLQAKSVSGDVEFNAPLSRGGRYEFNSHSGNVRVMLVNATGFELDASTFSGSIRSDFPVTLRSTPDTGDRNDRRRGPGGLNRSIRGTYGDASAFLAVRSFSGNVVITKK